MTDRQQKAIDVWFENQGKPQTELAAMMGIKQSAYQELLAKGREKGLTPNALKTFNKPKPKQPFKFAIKPLKVTVIGDLHDKPELDKRRGKWIGRHIAETQPDAVVQIGDIADFESLLTHVGDDTVAGKTKPTFQTDMASLCEMLDVIKAEMGEIPHQHITLGNHEHRLWKYENENPAMYGTLQHQFMTEVSRRGWTFSPYGEFHEIGGVDFTHVPFNKMGKPVGGKYPAQTVARDSIRDIVFGHTHQQNAAVCWKLGPDRRVKALNVGLAMDYGYIPKYCETAATGFSYGITDIIITNGRIEGESFIPMFEMERRYD